MQRALPRPPFFPAVPIAPDARWTSLRYWYALAQTLVVLLPLAVLVMSGPSDSAAMLGGGTLALVFLFRSGVRPDWRFLWVVSGGILVYAVFAAAHWEDADSYRPHYAILSLYYGLPAGLWLKRMSDTGLTSPMLAGWSLISALLAVAAYTAANAVGLENIVNFSGGNLIRTNIAGDQAYYWRFFYIANVIVGVIPYTLFALCSLPLLVIKGRILAKLGFVAAIAVSAYVNVLVLTRTAFSAGILGAVILLYFQFRSRTLAVRPTIQVVIAGVLLTPVVIAWALQNYSLELWHLFDRFSTTMDDGRFTIWQESVRAIAAFPFGGGVRRLVSANWGHNMFLDAGLIAGIPGTLAFVVTTAAIAQRFVRTLLSGALQTAGDVYMFSVIIGVFVVSMLMPLQVSMMCAFMMGAGYLGSLPMPSTPGTAFGAAGQNERGARPANPAMPMPARNRR